MSRDMTLAEFRRQLAALKRDIPAVMDELVIGEGRYAADQAKRICKQDRIVNIGAYRENFHSGDVAIRKGHEYKIDVFNNLDYAKPLEYGFRSHFVPGYWDGKVFVYVPGYPGGMYVGPPGGFVKGHLTLTRAVEQTRKTQEARLNRRLNTILKERLK